MITFLSRNTYAALPLSASPSTPTPTTPSSSTPSRPSSKPRLLLLTSLPNLSHYPTRETFHQSLLTYAREFRSTSCPLVIIVPDVGQMGAAEESWSVRKAGGEGVWDVRNVVGDECLACPSVMTIE
jgi:cell cycle checkpoint protein